MTIETMDLPTKNGGFFHSFLYVYQRVLVYQRVRWEIILFTRGYVGKSSFSYAQQISVGTYWDWIIEV